MLGLCDATLQDKDEMVESNIDIFRSGISKWAKFHDPSYDRERAYKCVLGFHDKTLEKHDAMVICCKEVIGFQSRRQTSPSLVSMSFR
jgi:hypothetical protein